jgi:hypothetical protein
VYSIPAAGKIIFQKFQRLEKVGGMKLTLKSLFGGKKQESEAGPLETDVADLAASRGVDISACKSVCLALGPYRNLTTLTAATLFLHPNCQVLNHAGGRIFGNDEVDFISNFSRARLDRFIQFAIAISAKGERGKVGGSITHSHAFTHDEMKEAFAKSGAQLTKTRIESLFWKESLHTSNLIREKNVDLAAMFAADSRIRFLLPIRNPMDCAISNLKTGLVDVFRGLRRDSPMADVTRAVLDEIRWFAELQEKFPSRFFHYFEHEISRDMLVRLAQFLELQPTEAWLQEAAGVMKIKPSYDHDPALVTAYRDHIRASFSKLPAYSKGLLAFIGE